jgi:hypothetical protein
MIYGAILLFKVFSNLAFKNIPKNSQNPSYLAFTFQFKIYATF